MESEKLSLTSKILLAIIVVLIIIFIAALAKILSNRSNQILKSRIQTSISNNKEVEFNMNNATKTQENDIDLSESIDIGDEE